jgi:GcrA cell cycle regulator
LVVPPPIFERAEPVELRSVEIDPHHLSLMELERGDCRYPYGGDEEGEAITFCGHPRRPGSSYCVPHFHLTCGPGTAAERAAGTILLRLVEATDAGGPGDVSPLFATHDAMRA